MGDTEFIVDKQNLEVKAIRVFKSSADRLWKCMTDPQLIPKWWGPGKYQTVVDKMDLRVGGGWRFVQSAEGEEFAFYGVYQHIDTPRLLCDTFIYEPMPDSQLVETTLLEELEPGKTRLTAMARYRNLADLEGMVDSGMESGLTEGHDRLAVLVED